MLRPLVIGLPIILVVVIGFVVGMNTVPFSSPYFKYVIIGYVVLFPAALLYTIIGTIRSVKRTMAGGDVTLRERGERTMATVVASRPLNMTVRVGGGIRQSMAQVRLKPDNHTPEITVTKAGNPFVGAPEVGDRVPLYLDRSNPKNHFVDWDQSSGAQRVTGVGEMGHLGSLIQAAMAQAKSGQGAVTVTHTQVGEPQVSQVNWSGTAGSLDPNLANQIGDLVSKIQGSAGQMGSAGAREADQGYMPPPLSEGPGSGSLEGRARIEGLKPYPDGTYDLDRYVTPRGKSSYRVAARVPVPAGTGLLQKGQMLEVRVDPDIASRVEVVWS